MCVCGECITLRNESLCTSLCIFLKVVPVILMQKNRSQAWGKMVPETSPLSLVISNALPSSTPYEARRVMPISDSPLAEASILLQLLAVSGHKLHRQFTEGNQGISRKQSNPVSSAVVPKGTDAASLVSSADFRRHDDLQGRLSLSPEASYQLNVSPSAVDPWNPTYKAGLEKIGICAILRCLPAKGADAPPTANVERLDVNTFIDFNAKILVHAWNSRRQARMFQHALRMLSQARHDLLLPACFAVPYSIVVPMKGMLVTATWIPPLLSPFPMKVGSSSMVSETLEMWRTGCGVPPAEVVVGNNVFSDDRRKQQASFVEITEGIGVVRQIPLYIGADRRYYALSCDEIALTPLQPHFPESTKHYRSEFLFRDIAVDRHWTHSGTIQPRIRESFALERLLPAIRTMCSEKNVSLLLSAVAAQTVEEVIHASGLNLSALFVLRREVLHEISERIGTTVTVAGGPPQQQSSPLGLQPPPHKKLNLAAAPPPKNPEKESWEVAYNLVLKIFDNIAVARTLKHIILHALDENVPFAERFKVPSESICQAANDVVGPLLKSSRFLNETLLPVLRSKFFNVPNDYVIPVDNIDLTFCVRFASERLGLGFDRTKRCYTECIEPSVSVSAVRNFMPQPSFGDPVMQVEALLKAFRSEKRKDCVSTCCLIMAWSVGANAIVQSKKVTPLLLEDVTRELISAVRKSHNGEWVPPPLHVIGTITELLRDRQDAPILEYYQLCERNVISLEDWEGSLLNPFALRWLDHAATDVLLIPYRCQRIIETLNAQGAKAQDALKMIRLGLVLVWSRSVIHLLEDQLRDSMKIPALWKSYELQEQTHVAEPEECSVNHRCWATSTKLHPYFPEFLNLQQFFSNAVEADVVLHTVSPGPTLKILSVFAARCLAEEKRGAETFLRDDLVYVARAVSNFFSDCLPSVGKHHPLCLANMFLAMSRKLLERGGDIEAQCWSVPLFFLGALSFIDSGQFESAIYEYGRRVEDIVGDSVAVTDRLQFRSWRVIVMDPLQDGSILSEVQSALQEAIEQLKEDGPDVLLDQPVTGMVERHSPGVLRVIQDHFDLILTRIPQISEVLQRFLVRQSLERRRILVSENVHRETLWALMLDWYRQCRFALLESLSGGSLLVPPTAAFLGLELPILEYHVADAQNRTLRGKSILQVRREKEATEFLFDVQFVELQERKGIEDVWLSGMTFYDVCSKVMLLQSVRRRFVECDELDRRVALQKAEAAHRPLPEELHWIKTVMQSVTAWRNNFEAQETLQRAFLKRRERGSFQLCTVDAAERMDRNFLEGHASLEWMDLYIRFFLWEDYFRIAAYLVCRYLGTAANERGAQLSADYVIQFTPRPPLECEARPLSNPIPLLRSGNIGSLISPTMLEETSATGPSKGNELHSPLVYNTKSGTVLPPRPPAPGFSSTEPLSAQPRSRPNPRLSNATPDHLKQAPLD